MLHKKTPRTLDLTILFYFSILIDVKRKLWYNKNMNYFFEHGFCYACTNSNKNDGAFLCAVFSLSCWGSTAR